MIVFFFFRCIFCRCRSQDPVVFSLVPLFCSVRVCGSWGGRGSPNNGNTTCTPLFHSSSPVFFFFFWWGPFVRRTSPRSPPSHHGELHNHNAAFPPLLHPADACVRESGGSGAPIRVPAPSSRAHSPSPLFPQANPYLLVYNTVLAAGWAYVLYLTFATVAAGGWTKEVLKVSAF